MFVIKMHYICFLGWQLCIMLVLGFKTHFLEAGKSIIMLGPSESGFCIILCSCWRVTHSFPISLCFFMSRNPKSGEIVKSECTLYFMLCSLCIASPFSSKPLIFL